MHDTLADRCSFRDLCALLESLEATTGSKANERCTRQVSQWWDRWDSGSIFPIFRLLLPRFDERRFGHREARLAPLLASAFTCAAASRLDHWQEGTPSTLMSDDEAGNPDSGVETGSMWGPRTALGLRGGHGQGDLSCVLQEIIAQEVRRGWLSQRALSVADVNATLDGLSGQGNTAALVAAIQRCSPCEGKWLVRIILRDLRIGGRDAWKAAWPRILMDGFLKHRRGGMYSFFLRQSCLRLACQRAEEAAALGSAGTAVAYWPLDPTVRAGTFVRVCCARAATCLDDIPRWLGSDLFVEVKYGESSPRS